MCKMIVKAPLPSLHRVIYFTVMQPTSLRSYAVAPILLLIA